MTLDLEVSLDVELGQTLLVRPNQVGIFGWY